MNLSDKINLSIAICAGLSAIVAAVYTYVTAKILSANRGAVAAMREQVHELSRPRIQIWPSPRVGTQIICLTVRNGGQSSAERVRLTIDRDFFAFGEKGDDKNLRNFSAFKYPFEALGPGAEILLYLGTGPQLYGSKDSSLMPLQFTIKATYESIGRRFAESTTVDLLPFLNSVVPQDPIAEEVEKVWKEVQKAGNEIRSIRQALASSNNSLQRP